MLLSRRANKRTKRAQPGEFHHFRAGMFSVFVFSFLAVLVARAVVIHVFPPSKDSLQSIADKQYQRHLELAPYRGTIFDRRQQPMAISVRKSSYAVNPRVFDPTPKELDTIANILGTSSKAVKEIGEKKSYFAWLARRVSQDAAAELNKLDLAGIYEVTEPARFYPSSSSAAHLIGYVGSENTGLLGLEQQYERDLRGQTVRMSPSKDARGKTIFLTAPNAAPEKTGNNIYLTIDRAIQEITEDALRSGMSTARAKSGFAIVSDPHTGQILALANAPSFDPNDPRGITLEVAKNHAIMDSFEPGSVMKPFVVARALELKSTTVNETHNCENGAFRVGGMTIHDAHPSKTLSTADALIHSSNICMYKIAERMGKERLFQAYRDFGFSAGHTLLGLPGELSGRIPNWKKWIPIQFANIAFGQGLTTTALEIVQAYGAIANGGNLMKPYLIDHIESFDGLVVQGHSAEVVGRVLSPNTARIVRNMLQRTVEEGTGRNGMLDSYTAGGKTGTTQKPDPVTRAYSKDKRIASFAGFAPAQDPRIVIYVFIDEPNGKDSFGGTWAAPVFKQIAEKSLKYLTVPADKTDGNDKGMARAAAKDVDYDDFNTAL